MSRLRDSAMLVVALALFGASVAAVERSPIASLRDPVAPRVLLLGTFHFQDAGLDAYKPEFPFDVRAARRQREVEEVLDRLAAWKPTIVAVESRPERQARLDSLFGVYPGNGMDTLRNEVFQVGFRLAKRLGLPGVKAVDAPARRFETDLTDEEWDRRSAALVRGALSGTDWAARFAGLYRADDSLKTVRTVRQTLIALNDPARVRAGHGHYLVGDLLNGHPGEYFGADGFVSAWYNRNIRIYSNIVRLARGREERILVLIGAGHVPILQELFLATPVARLDVVSEVLR